MNYIVLDLEWNQSAKGKEYSISSIDWFGQYGLTSSGNIVPCFNPTSGLNTLSIL